MKTGGRIELAPYRDWGCTSAHRQNRCRVMAPGTFGMEKKDRVDQQGDIRSSVFWQHGACISC